MVKQERLVRSELQDTVKRQLEGLSTSFRCLAAGFGSVYGLKPELDEQDTERVAEEISEDLCRTCRRFCECWKENAEDTYRLVYRLINEAKQDGRLQAEELPVEFLEHCHRPFDMVKEINRCLISARKKLLLENAMTESRGMVAGQFEEAARLVDSFTEELGEIDDLYKVQKRLAATQLRMLGIKTKQVLMFYKQERGIELRVLAKAKTGKTVTTKEAAEYLGKTLNRKLKVGGDRKYFNSKEYTEYIFCEQSNFKVLSGVARAAKMEDTLSGDSFSFLRPRSSSLIMMLADGMGSGELANRESAMVIEVLEQLLESGFKEEAAVRLIHSLLLLRQNQAMFSTIDLCAVNLYTGTCELIKAGAATTYLKREEWVEAVSSTSLPAGILNHMDYELKSKKLYDGDYIIMVSDGVLDCIGEREREEFLQEVIGKLPCRSPQEMAETILKAALACHSYAPVDDMTVLVSGIWKR